MEQAMDLKFEVHAKIQKPLAEVFDAIYNPEKLKAYFTTAGASAPLDSGASVTWDFHDFPGAVQVYVNRTVENEKIVLEWACTEGIDTRIEIVFEGLEKNLTLVTISESGWKQQLQKSLDESYSHCMGWTQMLCSLKAYLEHGVILRENFFHRDRPNA